MTRLVRMVRWAWTWMVDLSWASIMPSGLSPGTEHIASETCNRRADEGGRAPCLRPYPPRTLLSITNAVHPIL